MSRVLVLAVHPDDETLGCGGALLKHKANRDKIYWLIATSVKEEDGFSKAKVLEREREIKIVNDKYGFSAVEKLDISTMKVDRLPKKELITMFSKCFYKIKPEIIYLPFMKDLHSDHRLIFEAAYSCTKMFRYPFMKRILMMEIISETEFVPGVKDSVFTPNFFVDISDFLNKKLEIMKIYKSELGKHPFPRNIKNIKALATFRGAMAGCDYAESFMILKEIW